MSVQASLIYQDRHHQSPILSRYDPNSETHLTLTYLNEGGANVVFTLSPGFSNAALPSQLQGKLLRLHKDLPHLQATAAQLKAYTTNFAPLFPSENLIAHTAIPLSATLVTDLNNALAALSSRPAHRVGDFIACDDGVLVTSMLPGPGERSYQLKAKWLRQSPNAPAGAKRCRTCALRAQRAGKGVVTATDAQSACSLGFVDGDVGVRRAVVGRVVEGEGRAVAEVVEFLAEGEGRVVLRSLGECQGDLDQEGVLRVESESDVQGLCKAMTLRDCTLFVLHSDHGIEARLGDLDLKMPDKVPKWRKIERTLIEEGWYTNTEKANHQLETICLLSRGL